MSAPPILADFLRTELRNSARRHGDLLALIDDVRSGRRESAEMTGNLYGLSLTSSGAVIENLCDDTQSLRLDLQTLADAVGAPPTR